MHQTHLAINNSSQYRVTLDTSLNLFVIFDRWDETRFATGRTIEEAKRKLQITAA